MKHLKKRMLLLGFILFIFVIVIVKNTMALDSNELYMMFDYSENKEELKANAIKFIDLIDDSIFETSTFDNYSTLNKNYEFMTDFAISFILNNQDFYQDEIKILDNYQYVSDNLEKYNTNKYISMDIIYDITDKIFGIRDYAITNKYIEIKDDMIPLLQINTVNSKMKIEDIKEIKKIDNYYNFYVKYNGLDCMYLYKFKLLDNRLVLINLDIEV